MLFFILIFLLSCRLFSPQLGKNNAVTFESLDFDTSYVSVGIQNNNLIALNSYKKLPVFYNWYVINEDTKETIYKGTYSHDNFFNFQIPTEGNYDLISYIWDKSTDQRISQNAAKIHYFPVSHNVEIDLSNSKTRLIEDVAEYIPTPPIELYNFSENDIKIQYKKNAILCTNEYSNNYDLLYAWYIIDSDGNVIFKTDYSSSNELVYLISNKDNYALRAYILLNNSLIDMRNSVTINNLKFDS